MKKKGYRKSTLEGYSDVFKHLARNVDIDGVEAVKAFIAKTARTVNEACQLIEAGFEYITEIDDAKLFRKRK